MPYLYPWPITINYRLTDNERNEDKNMNKTDKKNTSVKVNESTEVLAKASIDMEGVKAIEERIETIFMTARRSTVDICECIADMATSHGYSLLGYSSIEEYAQDKYDIKSTQCRLATRICGRFANKVGEHWVIPEELKVYGSEKLELIQKFPTLPTTGHIDTQQALELLESLEITPTTTTATIKTALKVAKGLPLNEEKKEKSADAKKEESIETTLKKANDEKGAKITNIKDELSALYQKALDKTVSNEDFRQLALDTLARIEKTL